jgi:hypothetical protein
MKYNDPPSSCCVRAGRIVTVDSIEDRIVDVSFGPLTEDPSFSTQMEQAAAEWDTIVRKAEQSTPRFTVRLDAYLPRSRATGPSTPFGSCRSAS